MPCCVDSQLCKKKSSNANTFKNFAYTSVGLDWKQNIFIGTEADIRLRIHGLVIIILKWYEG